MISIVVLVRDKLAPISTDLQSFAMQMKVEWCFMLSLSPFSIRFWILDLLQYRISMVPFLWPNGRKNSIAKWLVTKILRVILLVGFEKKLWLKQMLYRCERPRTFLSVRPKIAMWKKIDNKCCRAYTMLWGTVRLGRELPDHASLDATDSYVQF